MRRIYFALLFLSSTLWGQNPADYNFVLDGTTTRWQKVYVVDAPCTPEAISHGIMSVGGVKDLTIVNDLVTFSLEIEPPEYKELGYTFMNRSIFVRHPITANVSIQTKENRYRVTVSNIMCHIDNDKYPPRNLNDMNTITTGDYTERYRKITMEILDYDFNKRFSSLIENQDDDW